MSMLNDPEMKDVVLDFCVESERIFKELQNYLEDFEDDPEDKELLENFGQAIDRIMGAAKSLGANKIGTYCELGKIIAYKASQSKDEKLIQIVTAVLFDSIDVLSSLIKNIKLNQREDIDGVNLEAFTTRLKWLAGKFQNIERSSILLDGTEELEADQRSIDQLLKDLGF